MSRKALAPLAGALLLAFPVASAPADDPPAKPTPCAEVLITDKTGDQLSGPLLGATPVAQLQSKGADNLDIKRVFFNTVNGVTTANIEITNLTKQVPAEYRTGRMSYLVDFDTIEGISFVRAEVDGTNVTYHAATVTSTPSLPTAGSVGAVTGQIDLKGQFIEGPEGIVSIELPPALSKPGVELTNVFANVSMRTDENRYVGYVNDTAPDDGATSKKNYKVTECPAPEPAPAAAPPAEAPAPPPPPAEPQPQPQQQPAAQPQQTPQEQSKPAAKKRKKTDPKKACQQKARKLKGKKRAAQLKKCAKIKRKKK